jgi:hypothetical protein
LPYRGACTGDWGNTTACPEVCDDLIKDGWANIHFCGYQAAANGADLWWCGDDANYSPCSTEPTIGQSFSIPSGSERAGLPVQVLLPWDVTNFDGCAINPDSQYSIERQTGDATNNAPQNTSCAKCPVCSDTGDTSNDLADMNTLRDCPNGALTGEGVAIGVVALLAIAMGLGHCMRGGQKHVYLLARAKLPLAILNIRTSTSTLLSGINQCAS